MTTTALTGDVTFVGGIGSLRIDNNNFGGHVLGFGGNDTIDVATVPYANGVTTLQYTPNGTNTGGVLMVSNAGSTASVNLVGNYTQASFTKTGDGHGGTLGGLNRRLTP